LDVASYARRGPGRRDHLSPAEIEQIARTTCRTPEVMIKVLTRGGQDLRSVGRHLDYINRRGDLDLETDDGRQLSGKGSERELLEDWDLDLEEHRRQAALEGRAGRSPPKLVHKVLFSMPPGTPPQKVLQAVKNFAREEFALKHRYVMALHTDEPHPHVHMVIKAMSEQGTRLNIRKATLRKWRQEFARHLRALGVPANATERAVRGNIRAPRRDGIYRAEERGDPGVAGWRRERVRAELVKGDLHYQAGKDAMLKTRREIERGWAAASELLDREGRPDLAASVRRFAAEMPPVRTEGELIAEKLRERARGDRTEEIPLAR